MKKKSLVVAICLVGIALFTSQASGAFTGGKWKLASATLTPSAVEFMIKGNKIAGPAGCGNMFTISNTNIDFNLMSAFVLTASAQKKKVDFDADETCEVSSFMVY